MLGASGDLDGLEALAGALGFGPATALGETAESLGIASCVRDAAVACGAGGLRALLCTVDGTDAARVTVARVAARLATRAPDRLWLVCVAERGAGASTVVAAWSGERRPPRVRALVVERGRVMDSDAESVRALAAAADGDDVLTHARWLDVLGREALTRRFYGALERVVGLMAAAGRGSAPTEVRAEVALLTVSRLLFLSFLEAKGWLDGDRAFLQRGFDRCVADGGGYHDRVLRPLFFGTLNTPISKRAAMARRFGRVPFLNGGLFACGPVERRWRGLAFPDDVMGVLFGELLCRYRFTAREDAVDWTEAAVDPEMLGRSFEGLMAADRRKATGAFYTPHSVVERVTTTALVEALAGGPVCELDVREAMAGRAPGAAAGVLGMRAAELRVLDPACGSGAFLVQVLERLAVVRAACGDGRSEAELRREVMTRSVFGVDVNPTAVWLCELRLWLSAVIDSEETDPWRVVPLPNLDRNVRVGDSLAGVAFDASAAGVGRRVGALRSRYARAVGARKRTLALCLEREERGAAVAAVDREVASAVAVRSEQVRALRSPDLFGRRSPPTAAERAALLAARERVRRLQAARRALVSGGALPFSYAAHFADVAERGGFDAVVGNPPWLRVGAVPIEERARLRAEYRVCRESAWSADIGANRTPSVFGGQVDMSALFIERSLRLVRRGGVVGLLVPGKLWRSLSGGPVRRLTSDGATLLRVEDYGDGPSGFDAVVYPSMVLLRRAVEPGASLFGTARASDGSLRVLVRRGPLECEWEQGERPLGVDGSASPWLLVPPPVRSEFERVRRLGVGWSASGAERVWLGVKSGCNDAFVVRRRACEGGMVAVEDASGRRGWVEEESIRPLVRGEGVRRWRVCVTDEAFVWTVGADGQAMRPLPDGVRRWLRPHRAKLERRADARRGPWWSVFRVDGSTGTGPRVVWSDIGRRPRASVLAAGDRSVVLNSCYVVRCGDDEIAWAWAALLNSSLAAAWLNVLAEPARGGYRRYLAWTVGMLPVPARWAECRGLLAEAGLRAAAGGESADVERALDRAVMRAYGVRERDVAALLAWEAR